jgi:signal transduction histidine kinase
VGRARARSLRSRILLTTLIVTAFAVVGFGVPAGYALSRLQRDEVVLQLEREASHILATVPDEALAGGPGARLRVPTVVHEPDGRLTVGLYDDTGQRLTGIGPPTSRLAVLAVRTGRQRVGTESSQLAVALSLPSDVPSAGAIRVAVATGDVAEDQREAWGLVAALAATVFVVSGLAAYLLSRRLVRPLEKLARNAQLLGEGDFTVRSRPTRVREIDAAGSALDVTAGRLGTLLQRERAFSSNASHQIRTPLAALRLELETAQLAAGPDSDVLADAVRQLDRLETTLDELIALTRDVEPPQTPIDLPAVLAGVRERWAAPAAAAGRRLVVAVPPALPPLVGSTASLAHVLDVLVDNALQHGRGDVTVSARASGGVVGIDVRDEGAGVAGDPAVVFQRRSSSARGHGIGLALARSLVEADGGRLELTTPGPAPVFSVLLPVRLAAAVPVGEQSSLPDGSR